MKTVAAIQARMGSTRLPGKVLADLGGASVLDRVVTRASRAKSLDELLVATTLKPVDDAIAAACEVLGVLCCRGDEQDVLDRYYEASQRSAADVVVRITADCPVIDPQLIDDVVRTLLISGCDYASNALIATYPRGLDVEALTKEALGIAWREASKRYEREHVTPYIYENPQRFKLVSLQADEDYSCYRWTLDTADDLELLRRMYAQFQNRDDFSWRDALGWLEQNPELAEINSHVKQRLANEGFRCSEHRGH